MWPPGLGPPLPQGSCGSVVRLQENCPNPVLLARSSEKEAPQGPPAQGPQLSECDRDPCVGDKASVPSPPQTPAYSLTGQGAGLRSVRAAPVWLAPESHLPGFSEAQTPGHSLGHLS